MLDGLKGLRVQARKNTKSFDFPSRGWGGGEKRFQFSSGYSTKNLSNENLKIGFVCKHKLHVFRDIHCTCGVRDSSSWLKLLLLS